MQSKLFPNQIHEILVLLQRSCFLLPSSTKNNLITTNKAKKNYPVRHLIYASTTTTTVTNFISSEAPPSLHLCNLLPSSLISPFKTCWHRSLIVDSFKG
ncbi:hypothetical protein HanXRQr2_Chr04g0169231 [Helianthus annuus]|uniref:Uncharacterized protein n=1 Tax=Helianthus annuus TaxID=4232 RepID=A0A251UYF7_HELAN|nr:hypothetical protein HanXRQr2_Chr04g0169231 [Helianthus annuus]KAJ0589155.1 hypothetical protein HanIR_Chr04g0182841 [Helianthus annuus]KAJ0931537.1 hypothetical protein HanPSC8_Chr04g0162841 [Helianthus annuus]